MIGNRRWPALAGAGLAAAATVAVALLTAGPAPVTATSTAATILPGTHPVPPVVEPVMLEPIEPADAVAINAAVPFSTAPNPAARPFRFRGDEQARAMAIDCLAAAIHYEAAVEGEEGQRAVAQVVLNRVRHPAFPASVCGVVFQGAERRTGCQFTFTCDGAMARTPHPAGWQRAQAIAAEALNGRIFRPVGLATHYHTDWVLPYWSGSLDKIVAVGTHLFFRWSGWWGTPPAFAYRPAPEIRIDRLAALSSAHRPGDAPDDLADASGVPDDVAPVATMIQRPTLLADAQLVPGPASAAVAADTGSAQLLAPGEDSFIFLLDPARPEGFAAIARRACGTKPFCKVQGWTERGQVPSGYPIPPERLASMAFSYLRDQDRGFERMLWNCRIIPAAPDRPCMVS